MSAYTLFLVPLVSLVSANLKSYKWYKEDVDEIGMIRIGLLKSKPKETNLQLYPSPEKAVPIKRKIRCINGAYRGDVKG